MKNNISLKGIISVEDIDRDKVLSMINEEDVFRYYNISVQYNKNFHSPFRKDRNPSCRLLRNKNGRIILCDYSGYFYGDCFDLIMKMERCGFQEALMKAVEIAGGKSRYSKHYKPPVSEFTEIKVVKAKWDDNHYNYWKKYHISPQTLDYYEVFPADVITINGRILYNRLLSKNPFEPVFGFFDEDIVTKVYFPMRVNGSKHYHSSFYVILGWRQAVLQKDLCDGLLVITKSYKDVMCLKEFGINSIAVSSENYIIPYGFMDMIASVFEKVIVFYDNDYSGKRALVKARSLGLTPYMIKGNQKDFSDLVSHSISEATKVAKQIKSLYYST